MIRSIVIVAGIFIWANGANASSPVPASAIGCVQGGKFISGRYDGFRISTYLNGQWRPAPLARFEGKTIEISGMLSPGDRFTASELKIIDHRCRPELHMTTVKSDPNWIKLESGKTGQPDEGDLSKDQDDIGSLKAEIAMRWRELKELNENGNRVGELVNGKFEDHTVERITVLQQEMADYQRRLADLEAAAAKKP